MKKLNLGSNDYRYPGFLNVDIRDVPGVDIVDDVTKLEKIEDNSVDHIIAEAILEHISPDRTVETLKLWTRKLKSGGVIEVMVPDGELIFDRYVNGDVQGKESPYYGNWEHLIHSMFGNIGLLREWHGEMAEFYGHHTLYCKSYLEKEMKEAGLVEIVEQRSRHVDCFHLAGKKP